MRLAARQGGGLLTNFDIAQSDTLQSFHFLTNLRHSLEKTGAFIDRHGEHIGNAFILELNFKGFSIISLPMTGVTLHIDIGQEMHLNFDYTIALTSLTSPSFNIEREASGLVAAASSLGQSGKPFANGCKGARIGGGV